MGSIGCPEAFSGFLPTWRYLNPRCFQKFRPQNIPDFFCCKRLFESARKQDILTFQRISHPTIPGWRFHRRSLMRPHPSRQRLKVLEVGSYWKKSQGQLPGMYITPVNNGINYLSTGAGFLQSTVSLRKSYCLNLLVSSCFFKEMLQLLLGSYPLTLTLENTFSRFSYLFFCLSF